MKPKTAKKITTKGTHIYVTLKHKPTIYSISGWLNIIVGKETTEMKSEEIETSKNTTSKI